MDQEIPAPAVLVVGGPCGVVRWQPPDEVRERITPDTHDLLLLQVGRALRIMGQVTATADPAQQLRTMGGLLLAFESSLQMNPKVAQAPA